MSMLPMFATTVCAVTVMLSCFHTTTGCLMSRMVSLCRLWIAPANERPLPEEYAEIYGGPLDIGDRGGIHVQGTREHIVLEAE
jgi:hypothetical protein